jgi:hypothetical protein
MAAAALILLALAGGSVATYFIMDEPRRQAKKRALRLQREQIELDEDRERFNDKAHKLKARADHLPTEVAAHQKRASELDAKTAEFDRRVISYADLTAENRILRTDLKNSTVHADYLEQLQHNNKSGIASIALQRDRLGRAYFDEVVSAAWKALTPSTYPTAKQRVRTAAERVRAEGFDLPKADEDQALADLHAQFERAVRAAVEREEQARLREQMREEQKRQQETEEALDKAERERMVIEAALQKALAQRALAEQKALADQKAIADEEIERRSAEVEQLRAQLAEAEAQKERAISEAQKTKMGHVYVISNLGSFGHGMFKIGMTRRLDPMDRVWELGDASVPFPFDVHMMIKCEDAPTLENALHRSFHAKRVNRVNLRKEFFRVTIDEIVAAVRQHHGEVEYTADAEALEYMNSQSANDRDVEEINKAHAEANSNKPEQMAMDD